MPQYQVKQLIGTVWVKFGRIMKSLDKAIDVAASRPLILQAKVICIGGNEVWPCIRGASSSQQDPDPEHRWAQLAAGRLASQAYRHQIAVTRPRPHKRALTVPHKPVPQGSVKNATLVPFRISIR